MSSEKTPKQGTNLYPDTSWEDLMPYQQKLEYGLAREMALAEIPERINGDIEKATKRSSAVEARPIIPTELFSDPEVFEKFMDDFIMERALLTKKIHDLQRQIGDATGSEVKNNFKVEIRDVRKKIASMNREMDGWGMVEYDESDTDAEVVNEYIKYKDEILVAWQTIKRHEESIKELVDKQGTGKLFGQGSIDADTDIDNHKTDIMRCYEDIASNEYLLSHAEIEIRSRAVSKGIDFQDFLDNNK